MAESKIFYATKQAIPKGDWNGKTTFSYGVKMAITSFRGEHSFLSNFHDCQIEYEGIVYPTTEHAFQATKTLDNEKRKEVVTMTAGESKAWGKNLELRSDWNEVRLQVMEDILRLKFSQEKFKNKLLATGDEELVEGNWWGDKFYGVYKGEGENHLGKILMKIRDELNNNADLLNNKQNKQ